MKRWRSIETTFLSIRVSPESGPDGIFKSLLYQHFVRCWLPPHLAFHSTFLNTLNSSEQSQVLLVTHPGGVPQLYAQKNCYHRVSMSCFLRGRERVAVLSFRRQEGPQNCSTLSLCDKGCVGDLGCESFDLTQRHQFWATLCPGYMLSFPAPLGLNKMLHNWHGSENAQCWWQMTFSLTPEALPQITAHQSSLSEIRTTDSKRGLIYQRLCEMTV